MINKKTCNNCKEKIKNSYNFCPNCGVMIKEPQKNWGMLGKNDSGINKIQMPIQNLGGGIMGKMLNSAMKMLEKEMQKEMTGKNPKIKLMINGKELNKKSQQENSNTKILPIEFTENNIEKWSKLKKEEPTSKIKRIGDKIQYEIDIPEVKSIKDISIIKLENNLEIRAIGETKGYIKKIPINLPLKKYTFLKGILKLELDAA